MCFVLIVLAISKLILTFVALVASRSFYPKFGEPLVEYQPDKRIQHEFLPLRIKKSDVALDQFDHEAISQLLDDFFTDEGYDQVSQTSLLTLTCFSYPRSQKTPTTQPIMFFYSLGLKTENTL